MSQEEQREKATEQEAEPKADDRWIREIECEIGAGFLADIRAEVRRSADHFHESVGKELESLGQKFTDRLRELSDDYEGALRRQKIEYVEKLSDMAQEVEQARRDLERHTALQKVADDQATVIENFRRNNEQLKAEIEVLREKLGKAVSDGQS